MTTTLMGMAGELFDVLRAYGQHMPQELLVMGPPPLLVDPPSLGGDKDIDGKGGNAGGGARGRRHLQNDGDRRGRDPLGSNKSLEEEEDDDGYGTPAGAPDLTATVRRHGSLHIQQRERRGDGGGGEKEEEAPEDDGICRVAGRGGEGRGGGTTVIITTCRTSGGRRRGPCTG